MIKRITLWLFILGTAFGSLYAFEKTRLPCERALAYTIGQFDPRFEISQAEFQSALAEAEEPWETALGKDLFRYDREALFPVNLVFDERQERTIESRKLEQEFATVQTKQDTIKGKYDVLVTELARARAEHTRLLIAAEERLKTYNERVARWNKSDRTDEDELEELGEEEKKLKQEQNTLETKRLRVNALVAQVNQYAKEEEKVISRYNTELDDFTEAYGTSEAFDQGIYSGASIDIYQFDDRDHLRMVLVHELGHALGLGHVENPKSIMYPMMGEQHIKNLTLSVEDRSALLSVCSVTAWDLLYHDLQKVWDLIST